MYRLWSIIFALLFVATPTMAQSRTVALLMAYDADQLSVPTVELFRQLKDDLNASEDFTVVPLEITRRHLPQGPQALGLLPVLERKRLLAAHPPARSFSRTIGQHASVKKRMVPAIQALVDTLAIDGALVLDCLTVDHGARLRGCGLYYYDRQEAQVRGSIRKSFRVGIRDATRWSSVFSQELNAGLKAKNRREEKIAVEKALNRTSPSVDSSRVFVELGAGGQQAGSDGSAASPSLSLTLGQRKEDIGFGLMAMTARTSLGEDGITKTYSEQGLGLAFSVGAKALTSLEWDLGIHLVGVQREMRKSYESLQASTSFQQTKDIKMGVSPGVLWYLGEKTACGFGFTSYRYFSIDRTTSQDHDLSSSFTTNGLGMALRLRTEF